MTTPSERTRALRWAGEFLREVGSSDGFSEDIKHKVNVILRHYPMQTQLEAWVVSESDKARTHTFGAQWLGPECEEMNDG